MNEEYIKDAIEKIVEIYSNIESDLLIEIASHFSINEEFINSDYWRLKKLDEMNLLNSKTMKILSNLTNKSPRKLKKAINDLGYKMLNYDYLKEAYEDNKLKINPDILIKNKTIQNIIKKAYDEVNNSLIRISNKISESVRNSYLEVLEASYLKISMGTHSYQEAIRTSINELSNEGIITLTYNTTDEKGRVTGIRNYDIEGTVRRDLLTSVRKLNNDLSSDVADELNCEYLYLSEHLRCRPTHFDWQGTIIKKEDLSKVTGYGTGGGLGGPNCAHYFEPYFGDARGNDLKSISKAKAEKQYNLSQHQRYLERGVRKWLRKANMYKASSDNEYYKKCNKKVKEWQLRTKEFTEEHNLRRDFTREYISDKKYSLGSSAKYTIDNHPLPKLLEEIDIKDTKTIEKTLKYYENQIKDSTIENAIVITEQGKVYQCFGNETNVWPNLDLGDELFNAYVTHNHLKEETYFSFSSEDINLFEKYNLKRLRGIDYKYIYEFNRNKKAKLKIPLFGDVSDDTGLNHISNIQYALDNNIYYMRWENDK